METKPAWQSKTNWVALIIAISAFFPNVQGIISSNPEMFAQGLSLIMIALRFITKDKISIS